MCPFKIKKLTSTSDIYYQKFEILRLVFEISIDAVLLEIPCIITNNSESFLLGTGNNKWYIDVSKLYQTPRKVIITMVYFFAGCDFNPAVYRLVL